MEGVTIGHNFEMGTSKDNSRKVWSKLAQWFLGKRLKCENDRRRLTDNRQNLMAKTHMAFGQVS